MTDPRHQNPQTPKEPKRPSADVLRFPTVSERIERDRKRWLNKWTRPFDGGPKGAA